MIKKFKELYFAGNEEKKQERYDLVSRRLTRSFGSLIDGIQDEILDHEETEAELINGLVDGEFENLQEIAMARIEIRELQSLLDEIRVLQNELM